MQFGMIFPTRIDDWQLIKYAEDLGYDRAWVPDSQMVWSDCYATLALAAHNTSRIHIGSGVSIPGTRIAPVTAHSIASINQIAPGRVFLGIGTGHTAMRVMGMQPMKIKPFREYLRVVQALLHGEEVEYTLGDTTRTIRFLHRDLRFINLEDPIPIYIAANGPRALKTTGEFGDGLTTLLYEDTSVLESHLQTIQAGAQQAGRTLPDPFHVSAIDFLIQLWIVPIPAEFGGLEVEPLEELPEAVADLGERFVERKMFAEVILPLEPQVFCRVLFRGVGSKQQTRHGPLCLRYPRIFASQKLLHLGPPVIAGSIPQV